MAPRTKPKLADIATMANVSTATVSRVLNGKPGASHDVRHAVLAALDQLGYERPTALRTKTRGLVGVVVPELRNPIFPAFAQSIESRLSAYGYTTLLCTQSPGGTTELQCVELLLNQGVSGIIFVSGLHADATTSHEHYSDLAARGIALTFVNGHAPDIDGAFLATDDVTAIDACVRHLAALGHRTVGLAIGPDRYTPSHRKIEAFRNASRGYLGDDDLDRHVVTSLFTVEGGHAATAQLLGSGHTAVICGSDLMALGAIRAVRSAGLDVPGDFSVIGYDDSTMVAFVDPPLTTVHQPVGELSAAAVTALIAEIDGNPTPHTELLFRPELIVRSSTGPAPA